MEAFQRFLNGLPKKMDQEWWIKFRDPADILKNHDNFLYCEVAIYCISFLTLIHALRHGGRYKWLWLASIFHGLTVELICYFFPDIDNFWHAQSVAMLAGQRLPLHIVLLYPVFYYIASVAVAKMRLRWWAEPFAVGLFVVLLDVPYDIMGIKLLWWTWHDTDPNIFDRHYWVPWTSYYFHATFASGFTFIFHGCRNFFCHRALKFQSAGFLRELAVALLTGMFAMPLGVLQFIPIYHPLHDSLGIHSEVCVLMLLGFYALVVWSSDRFPYEEARVSRGGRLDELVLGILLHYGLYIYLVVTSKPEQIVSIGRHQPIGKCGLQVPVLTPFGQTLYKEKYLCLTNFSEDFSFDCVKDKKPAAGAEWYTICGTDFPNQAEYICVVTAFCFLGLFVYWQALFQSGPLPSARPIQRKVHKD